MRSTTFERLVARYGETAMALAPFAAGFLLWLALVIPQEGSMFDPWFTALEFEVSPGLAPIYVLAILGLAAGLWHGVERGAQTRVGMVVRLAWHGLAGLAAGIGYGLAVLFAAFLASGIVTAFL